MRKILPINEKPLLSSYSSHAKFLAMISTQNDYEDWFYANYIQLISKRDFNAPHDIPLDFFIDIKRDSCYYFNNPLIYTQCIKVELINSLKLDIVSFIISAINKNYYVDICLNEYYISVKNSFNKYDTPHDNLVYGYDMKKNIFYMAGYIKHLQSEFIGTYGLYEISFNELLSAFEKCPYAEWYKSIFLYSFESHGGTNEKYKFNIKIIKRALKDYLYSENSLLNYSNIVPVTNKFSFGLEVYNDLLKNLNMGYYDCDIRPLALLVEHKQCMENRLKYLYINKYIAKADYNLLSIDLSEIKKNTVKARNLQMKYMISKRGTSDFYVYILKELPKLERKFINDLISLL